MPTRYTDAEWASIIQQTERELVVSSAPYACPEVPSVDFCKTVDHTLLKLEAKEVQFDELCAEARTERFAVSSLLFLCDRTEGLLKSGRGTLMDCDFLQTVCVRPQHVKQCVANLRGSDVRVASVIGFHEGTYDLLHKAQYVPFEPHAPSHLLPGY